MTVRTPAHTALDDQIDAACNHAVAMLHAAGPTHVIPLTPGSWLVDHATALINAVHTATATRCRHITRVQIMHAAVWVPHRIVCSACIHQLAPDAGDENLCDHCHQHRPVVHPGATAIGPILLAYGLCPPCARTTGITPLPRKDTPR